MIRTYTNTKSELDIATYRLNCLLEEKEELYTRHFPMTAKLKDTVSHSNNRNDSMANYLNELTKINKITGMSLEEEIERQRNVVNRLKYYLNLMDYTLQHTSGIENELFSLIILKGKKKTRAVEEIAEKYNKEPRTIWKYYYSKISKEISKCTVKI